MNEKKSPLRDYLLGHKNMGEKKSPLRDYLLASNTDKSKASKVEPGDFLMFLIDIIEDHTKMFGDIIIKLEEQQNVITKMVKSQEPKVDVSQLISASEKIKSELGELSKDVGYLKKIGNLIETTPEKSLSLTILNSKIKTLQVIVLTIYLPLLIAIITYLLFLK